MPSFLKSVFLFIFSLLWITTICYSITPLKLEKKDKIYEINNTNFDVLVDSTGDLSFNQVIESPDKFFKSKSKFFRNESGKLSYWFKFTVKNESDIINDWLLVSYNYGIKEIDVYVIDKNQNVSLQPHEEATALSERLIFHKQPSFYLDVRKGEEVTVLIRTIHSSKSDYTFAIYSNYYFSSYYFSEYFWFGTFYGILGFVALFGLLWYGLFKDKLHLYFTYLVVSQAIYMLFRDGNGLLFIIPNNPELIEEMKNISRLLFTSSLVFYNLYYLKFTSKSLIYKLLVIVVIVRLILLLFSYMNPDLIFKPFEFIITSICFALSLNFYLTNKAQNIYLLIGNGTVWICFLPYLLNLIGLIDQKPIYFFGLYYGIIIELIVLLMSIGATLKKNLNHKNQ